MRGNGQVKTLRYEIATPSLRSGLRHIWLFAMTTWPRAAVRSSRMAHTISDWSRCISPAVKTPGTLVIQVSSRQTIPRCLRLGRSPKNRGGFQEGLFGEL